jgi:hypothetical protein
MIAFGGAYSRFGWLQCRRIGALGAQQRVGTTRSVVENSATHIRTTAHSIRHRTFLYES